MSKVKIKKNEMFDGGIFVKTSTPSHSLWRRGVWGVQIIEGKIQDIEAVYEHRRRFFSRIDNGNDNYENGNDNYNYLAPFVFAVLDKTRSEKGKMIGCFTTKEEADECFEKYVEKNKTRLEAYVEFHKERFEEEGRKHNESLKAFLSKK